MDAPYDHSSDSELFPPNASMVDLCPRPFGGVTLCATGTMDKVRWSWLRLCQLAVKLTVCGKPTLFKQAFELGATSTSDLTDRVTHLLANSHGGAKYMVRLLSGASCLCSILFIRMQCALERKIPIMHPEWITDAYQVWLRGDDVDLAEVSTT
jgi:DNA replication regulator DPB11